MQNTLNGLARQAIEAALKGDWKLAVEVNSQILEKEPKSFDAKIRLGRAYIQIGEFLKAKKIFKEVLEVDPINPIALKNLKLASDKKSDKKHPNPIDTRLLLKEPGTSTETNLVITAKRLMADDFVPGEVLELKIDKKLVSVYRHRKDEEYEIGRLEGDIVNRINNAKNQSAEISASFLSGENKNIKIILKTSIPVFKAEKQDVRPYIKSGSLDEGDSEIPELLEAEE